MFDEDMLKGVPDTLIQPNDMVPILVDIQVAESAAGQLKTDSLKTDALLETYYSSIFKHYAISPHKFENSFAYYTEHPLVLNYIYEKVVEQMNLMDKGGIAPQDTSKNKQPKPPVKQNQE